VHRLVQRRILVGQFIADDLLDPRAKIVIDVAVPPEFLHDLHDYRHSSLTHLGEQGVPVDADGESRRKKPENVRRYFKPSPEAIADLTSLLAPGGINR
jgi:hypothetical protein